MALRTARRVRPLSPPDSLSRKLRDTFYAATRAALEVSRAARRADLPTLAEPNATALESFLIAEWQMMRARCDLNLTMP